MNLLIIFGSQSDQHIMEPLCTLLSKKHCIFSTILSAHRNPEELDLLLKSRSFDLIIAGAGLAAHLPGVIASKVTTPVIGLPVNSALGGLDATLSILQMPFGVPVLTSGPDQYKEIVNFVDTITNGHSHLRINLVIRKDLDISPYKKEIDRTIAYAQEANIALELTQQYDQNKLNIILVTSKDDIRKETQSIHVPLFSQSELPLPTNALKVLEWMLSGGLWVGTNNTRNAIKFFEKLFLRSSL